MPTYNLKGVSDNADSHELLAVVAAVHHEGVGETLNDGALSLAEALSGITASGVREVDGRTNLDVVTASRGNQSALVYPFNPPYFFIEFSLLLVSRFCSPSKVPRKKNIHTYSPRKRTKTKSDSTK